MSAGIHTIDCIPPFGATRNSHSTFWVAGPNVVSTDVDPLTSSINSNRLSLIELSDGKLKSAPRQAHTTIDLTCENPGSIIPDSSTSAPVSNSFHRDSRSSIRSGLCYPSSAENIFSHQIMDVEIKAHLCAAAYRPSLNSRYITCYSSTYIMRQKIQFPIVQPTERRAVAQDQAVQSGGNVSYAVLMCHVDYALSGL